MLFGLGVCAIVQLLAHAAPPIIEPEHISTASGMDWNTIISAGGQFGIAGLVVYWTLTRDKEREARMSVSIEEQQRFIRTELASQNREVVQAINRLCDRPCMRADGGRNG
jgi:hypothetical protein